MTKSDAFTFVVWKMIYKAAFCCVFTKPVNPVLASKSQNFDFTVVIKIIWDRGQSRKLIKITLRARDTLAVVYKVLQEIKEL